MQRRITAALLAASLAMAGCSGQVRKHAGPEDVSRLPQARYAVLLGNVFPAYRELDGTADGLLWLVDEHGNVVGQSGHFEPIMGAALRTDGRTTWFTGGRESYRLTVDGLRRYPRERESGGIGLFHLRPRAAPIATVNIGSKDGGAYETRVMALDSPETDFQVPRYVDAMATCGTDTYLLTTEGLAPESAQWESLRSKQVLATRVVESTDGIGTVSLACAQGVIWAIDQQRTRTSEVRQVVLHRWDTGRGFTDAPVRMTRARDGAPLGVDGSWDDGLRMPTAYWWLDDHLHWLTVRGEVWKTDVTTGATEQVFEAEGSDAARTHRCTPQPNSVVCARQLPDGIEIDSYRLPDGAPGDHVVVRAQLPLDDLIVMDVGALAGAD